jgi:putative PEP-CTERM system integral membrane protein
MNEQGMPFLHRSASARGWAYGLFWSWNAIFLVFMGLGFAPLILPEMIDAVRTNSIPAAYLVLAAVLTAIPAAAVILGLTLLRRSPGKLFTLGYGVEGPLMLVLAIRFFIVRDVVPAVALLLVVAGLGMLTLLWQILDRNIEARGALPTHGRLVGLTLLLIIGLYASAFIAFYAVPFAVALVGGIGDFLVHMDLWRTLVELKWAMVPVFLVSILGIILGVYTATLFVAMPIAVPILYARAWWQGVRALMARYGRLRAAALPAVVLAVCALLAVQTNQQPQHLAFALLKTPPASLAEAKALMGQEGAIRAGLLNAYLAPWRYISAVGEVRHVSELYKWTFHMSQAQAMSVERLYDTVARPVLYEPVNPPPAGANADNRALREEPLEAAQLYRAFFDRPITEGEHDAVVQAARSTWSADQAQTAWQAVDDREVHLARQEITVAEKGDWAEVELYEVYQNRTQQRQEVVYYFSLPESAVVTGLWLGNSADRAERFAYVVAPRGAAQAVYRNEVRYNRDPALVEQIGPRQYRLRVFPVEPPTWSWDKASGRSRPGEAPALHMWLTWRVLARDNAWPLPHLAEKRNVYWDETSVRSVNGKLLTGDAADWLPASLPAAAPIKPIAHRIDLPGGETVIAQPVAAGDLAKPPAGLRLAVVLDRSRSMADRAADVQAVLARLADAGQSGAAVEVYLTASKYRGEAPARIGLASLDPHILYYGGQNAAELLAQFDALRAGEKYDAIFVLTDGSGFVLGDSSVKVPVPDAPVWMVHLGGNLPLGYDDATLEAIQASGGGVAGDVVEALTRLAAALAGQGDAAAPDIVDGYIWRTLPAEKATDEGGMVAHAAGDDFAGFAARRLVLATLQRQRGELTQLETLDRLQAIAVEHSIVTPYSSMLVLVNERQKTLLEMQEAQADRFQREGEAAGETVPASPFNVTGVPEPGEWLLLGLAAAMLAWYLYTTRRAPRRAQE